MSNDIPTPKASTARTAAPARTGPASPPSMATSQPQRRQASAVRDTTVAFVIVSYNCCEPLLDCLRSLRDADPESPVVVVDNASRDGTPDAVRREFPSVHVIANATNRGFAHACNQGIAATRSTFVAFLNPDTQVAAPALDRLQRVLEDDPEVGACGPRILNPDGTLQPSCRSFPSLGVMLPDEIGISRWFPHSKLLARYRLSGWPHDESRDVEQLMGACLFVRRSALDSMGGFDERFFLYFEEVDLCRRLQGHGWRCRFVHDASIVHLGGRSSSTALVFSLRNRYRSLFEYYRKCYPRWQLGVLKCAVQVGALLRAASGRRAYWTIAREVWSL